MVNYTASGTIIWLRGAEKKTVREEGERQRGNANFCCLSPAAVLAVWHLWWMVLHWFCWPLTSAHCYQSRNKREEEKRRITQQAQGMLPFINAHTGVHTEQLFPTAANTCMRTTTYTHAHTNSHADNLCPTAVCICWAKITSVCLANQLFARSSTHTHAQEHPHTHTTTTTTSIWCNNGTTVGKLLGAWIQTGTSSKLLIFCISRGWKSARR